MMSEIQITDEKGYNKMKKYDKLPYRLEFIKKILFDNRLTPLLDIDLNETATFSDIRNVLQKKTYDFNYIMNTINAKLVYIKSGSTGHTFKGFTVNGKGEIEDSFAVKVVAYPKKERYGNLNDIKRPENAELFMLKLLSYFVVNNQTPHIILPIATFNTSIKPFLVLKDTIIKHKRYDEFVEKFNNGEYYDNVSVLISEWANSGDLLDYFRKNIKSLKLVHYKVIFFQVLSVLAVIQNKYPEFRHNDMKANNLLVHKIECHRNNKYKYKINGQKYIIPNVGIQVKLWDFDFACIPPVVRNTKVEAKWTDKINIKPVQNKYYDIHYFFNTLTKKGFISDFFSYTEIPQDVKDFFRRVVPEKYSTGKEVTDRGRLLVDDEYLSPDGILKSDPFFAVFRTE